jgi:hypothetical protein
MKEKAIKIAKQRDWLTHWNAYEDSGGRRRKNQKIFPKKSTDHQRLGASKLIRWGKSKVEKEPLDLFFIPLVLDVNSWQCLLVVDVFSGRSTRCFSPLESRVCRNFPFLSIPRCGSFLDSTLPHLFVCANIFLVRTEIEIFMIQRKRLVGR